MFGPLQFVLFEELRSIHFYVYYCCLIGQMHLGLYENIFSN